MCFWLDIILFVGFFTNNIKVIIWKNIEFSFPKCPKKIVTNY